MTVVTCDVIEGRLKIFYKSVDVVIGIRTWGRRMVGADGSTELFGLKSNTAWPFQGRR